MPDKNSVLFKFDGRIYRVPRIDEEFVTLPDGRQLCVTLPEHEDPNHVFEVVDCDGERVEGALDAEVYPGTPAVALTDEELTALTAPPAEVNPVTGDTVGELDASGTDAEPAEPTEEANAADERPLAVSSDGEVLDPTTHGVDSAYEPHHESSLRPTMAEDGVVPEGGNAHAVASPTHEATEGDFVPATPT